MTSPWTWLFVTFQILLDAYIASAFIYWIVQKRKYGTFNPLSPFQHREIQDARQLLQDLKYITEKSADLVRQTRLPAPSIAEVTPKPVERTPLTPSVPPAELPERVIPSAFSKTDRDESTTHSPGDIQSQLRSGRTPEEIARASGRSLEEIQLIQAFL